MCWAIDAMLGKFRGMEIEVLEATSARRTAYKTCLGRCRANARRRAVAVVRPPVTPEAEPVPAEVPIEPDSPAAEPEPAEEPIEPAKPLAAPDPADEPKDPARPVAEPAEEPI
jgi:outer membrane biosynthesis protein TonB